MSTAALISETPETTETEDRRPNGVWDYISPSRLNLWLRCPLAWRLKYRDGIKLPTTPALFVGARVHEGLEVHYRHRQLGITLDASGVVQRLVDTWDEAIAAEDLQLDFADESQNLKQQAAGLVQAYQQRHHEDPARSSRGTGTHPVSPASAARCHPRWHRNLTIHATQRKGCSVAQGSRSDSVAPRRGRKGGPRSEISSRGTAYAARPLVGSKGSSHQVQRRLSVPLDADRRQRFP